MPYWFERKKIKLPAGEDRRVKVSEEEKERIKDLYKAGWSIRKIAREYAGKCSRRLIQFILYPDRAKRQVILRRRRVKEGREKWYKGPIYMRRYMEHKKAVFGLKVKQKERG